MTSKAAKALAAPPISDVAILVVDDTAGKRLSIRSVLEPLGHTIVEAESGEAALRAVFDQQFAVILMDVQMPEMDGYETAKLIRLRDESEYTPIIFITAHSREEAQIITAYDSGAVDFIFAPLVPSILRAKVGIFIDLYIKSNELERSINDIRALNNEFRDSEARTRSVLENIADGIVTVNDAGIIESINRAASAALGYEEREAIGEPFSLMVTPKHPDDFASLEQAERRMLSQNATAIRRAESMGRRKDGTTFPIELELSDVRLGDRLIHIGCFRDVSERNSYTDTLKYKALHDDLTDLPNRVLFEDRVNHALRLVHRTHEPIALLLLDLNNFKRVNDTHGHQHGDKLLELVAQRLKGCMRDGDTVARLGGDEFGILPLGMTDLAGAVAIAWTVRQALEEPFDVLGHSIEVDGSIGITLAPEHGDNIDDLLRRSDLAMYDAKRSGSDYAVFASEQEETPARRLALLGDLWHCVERDELVLHYQPKIDLTTKQTVGVEALVRWNHPSGRLVPPDEFIPEIERNELMIPITEWVINEALRRLSTWRESGYEMTMAVNLGARCLADDSGLLETADRLAKEWDVAPELLTFELTESALLDTAIPGTLQRLESMGERLSIDDFGTGYSSLVYLRRLPVVEIKADRSFVSKLTTVRDDAVIVRAIIDLARNLGLKVVAEGVEDEETMEQLTTFGCDTAQGYYFSRPMPGDDMIEWLMNSEFGMQANKPKAKGALRSMSA